MPFPSGAIAGWKCNDLADYVAATHTLIGAGTAPFSDNSRSGTKSLGQLSGSNYFRNATARTALSGATTWGISFRFFAASYSTGPQILSIGNTTGDNIVYRVLSTGAIRAIINDSIFVDSSTGLVIADRWMAGGLEFTGGVLKAYAALDSVTNTTPALTITNAAGDFPTQGSIWLGVAGTNPSFLPFVGGYIDDVIVFSTAPGSYPQVDTGPTPSVGSATEESLTVSWTDEAGVTAYDLYRHTSNSSGSATRVARIPAGQQSIVVGGLSASTAYYFWLKPVFHPQNIGAFGSSGTATTGAAASTADTATGLAATTTGRDSVRLTWTDGSGTEAQLVYRHTADSFGAASVIGGVDAGVQVYNDSGLASGTQYYYWLLPLGTGGPGTQTSSVNATTYGAAGNPGDDIVSQIVTAAKSRLASVLSADFEQLKHVRDLKKNERVPWGYGVEVGDEEPSEPSVFGSYTSTLALQVVLYRNPNSIQNDRDVETATLTLHQWKDRVHRDFTTTRLYENDVIVRMGDPETAVEYLEDAEVVALRLTFPVIYRNSRI